MTKGKLRVQILKHRDNNKFTITGKMFSYKKSYQRLLFFFY